MKSSRIAVTAAAIFCLAFSFSGMAQPKHHGPKAVKQTLQQVEVYSGKVGDWESNDEYVYDGFYLETANEKFLVKFSPLKGDQITSSIKSGNKVTVNGVGRLTRLGEKEIRLVSIMSDGKVIYENTPGPESADLTETFVTGSGKITELQKNKMGKVRGFMLDNKTILRVPVDVAKQLNLLAIEGAEVAYRGVKKPLHAGEVAWGGYTIIHCQTITIKGKQYLTI
jgi:hypothetical protein